MKDSNENSTWKTVGNDTIYGVVPVDKGLLVFGKKCYLYTLDGKIADSTDTYGKTASVYNQTLYSADWSNLYKSDLNLGNKSIVFRVSGSDLRALYADPPNFVKGFFKWRSAYYDTVTTLFHSNDGGNSWVGHKESFCTRAILNLLVHGDTIYAGTDGAGVIFSGDKGVSWKIFGYGLDSRVVNKLVAYKGMLIAATDSGSFIVNLSDTDSISVSKHQDVYRPRSGPKVLIKWINGNNIKLDIPFYSGAIFRICTLAGRVVFKENLSGFSGNGYTLHIPSHLFSQGVYMLNISTQSGTLNYRFVVKR